MIDLAIAEAPGLVWLHSFACLETKAFSVAALSTYAAFYHWCRKTLPFMAGIQGTSPS
jgi:hypothetical protein